MAGRRKAYDLVVLGGGPAGLVGAATAAKFGKSVAVIEAASELGGAGINTGTVPSKTLRETALTLSGVRSRQLHGVDLSLRRDATVADFLYHERTVKAGLHEMVEETFRGSNADVYQGAGEFEDPHTIRVLPGGASIHGDRILIATGSSPVRPDIFPASCNRIYDSDTILALHEMPKKLAVVGAGTIGCEYAGIFAALSTEVHVIDGRSEALSFLDAEVASAVQAAMERNGVRFHWRERVCACHVNRENEIELSLSSGVRFAADAAFIAAGRKSNTDRLNLAAAGITPGERGLICVDKHFRTAVSHIYAAGDVIGPPALASTGMEQARRAMRHAFAANNGSDIAGILPAGVYTIPEAAMAGETEETLKSSGVPYVVGRGSYDHNPRGKIIGDSYGFLKLLVGRQDHKLLGVHVLGEQATELVHIGLIAMLCDATVGLFDEACFNLPTLGQLYKTAALDAMRQL
jgi:NAD(P) transhydrogenase